MIKNSFTVVAVLLMVFAYVSCTSDRKHHKATSKVAEELEFSKRLTSEDTINMLKLADDCMEMLKNKDIDGALNMLNEYDDSTEEVSPLSDETAKRLRHVFKVFPVLKYDREYFSFMREGVNDVRYKIWFAEEPNPEKNGEPVTRFMFNPVMVDGDWYLCVKRYGQDYNELRQ